jgi:hypothetical protein
MTRHQFKKSRSIILEDMTRLCIFVSIIISNILFTSCSGRRFEVLRSDTLSVIVLLSWISYFLNSVSIRDVTMCLRIDSRYLEFHVSRDKCVIVRRFTKSNISGKKHIRLHRKFRIQPREVQRFWCSRCSGRRNEALKGSGKIFLKEGW